MRALLIAAVLVAGLSLVAEGTAAAQPPWRVAGDVRLALADAETELALGDAAAGQADLGAAGRAAEAVFAGRPAELAAFARLVGRAAEALRVGDGQAFESAKARAWTLVLGHAFREATNAAAHSDVPAARAWLLVREFRPPTRFSRASADATVALDRLAAGKATGAVAANAVRSDLLDSYDYRLRAALASGREADQAGLRLRAAEAAALAQGYWEIVRDAFVAQRSRAAARKVDSVFASLAAAPSRRTIARAESALEGFRAAPLSKQELLRRAGQVERFLKLVPIEYGRGVQDGRVIRDFEIQEAITFRDGAAAALRDIEPVLLARDGAAARRVQSIVSRLGDDLSNASRGSAVAAPEAISARADEALHALSGLYPAEWKEAAKTADFDVIAATLDRLQAAAESGDWSRAESARLEAYGVFELGPEQRLRGLAPGLFQDVEGYFWYGAHGHDGLVQLIKQKASPQELRSTRAALDEALRRAEERIGSGPQSKIAVVTNSAIIVFREGLEAVLILAALMAGMVGAQRRHRRPLLLGVGVALLASVITWVVTQTVLTSLSRYGERLEAIVSLVAIGVLLLILNWFYHRVYWQQNLQQLHRKKHRILAGAGLSLVAAQVLGLVLLGFTSVYREGFETVLFLQALTLEAGAFTVLQGVALGLAGAIAVFVLVVRLERKLPHKKMLIVTGLLITWVLVVMVGTTVQTLQKVGWLPVSPVEGLELPYWSGLWLGLYPTWEGLCAQGGAAVLVLGSYFAAERLRAYKRARILAPAGSP